MRICLKHNGTVFEYERKPIPEGRFKAVCAIAAAGIYASMTAAVTALCGIPGLLLTIIGTVLVLMVYAGLK